MNALFWEAVFDRCVFQLRVAYSPGGMPPVCLLEYGLKEGTFRELQPIEMNG